MPEHARRFAAALYDQQSEEPDRSVADWGGDELFTRMPQPRALDTAPPPRFRPSLAAPDGHPAAPDGHPAAPDGHPAARDRQPAEPDRHRGTADRHPVAPRALTLVEPADEQRRPSADVIASGPRERRFAPASGAAAPAAPAERHPLSVVPPFGDTRAATLPGEEPGAAGRPTKVITGRPDAAPRPLPGVPAGRRRPGRTVAERVGPRPERIVGWAFALGLLLILIAITTADAATI